MKIDVFNHVFPIEFFEAVDGLMPDAAVKRWKSINTIFDMDARLRMLDEFDDYMANTERHWWGRRFRGDERGPIAYFCAEYGLHESLNLYSGGLGVLAAVLAWTHGASQSALVFTLAAAVFVLRPPPVPRAAAPGS